MRKLLAIVAIWAMSFAAPVSAQDTANFVIGFEGEVVASPGGRFQFFSAPGEPLCGGADGCTTTAPPSGPVVDLPDYPAQVGDAFGLVISAALPTPEAFASGSFDNLRQSDGTFLIPLSLNEPAGINETEAGQITNIVASEPFGNAANPLYGQVARPYPRIAFDPADGSYTLDQNSSAAFGTFIASPLGTYVYDPETNSATLTEPGCDFSGCLAPSIAFRLLVGTMGFASSRVPILNPNLDSIASARFRANGTFFVRPASATPVPAPPMMLIFAAGAFAILRRRRKMAALPA